MKILLMHNTCAEYRIKWFKSIANKINIDFIFTSDFIYDEKYRLARTKLNKNALFLTRGLKGYFELLSFLKNFNYDFVLLPAVDSLRELIISNFIYYICKKKNIKTGYFWEKWEAPIKDQPIKRRIKNWFICKAASTIFKRVDIVFSGGTKSREYFIFNGVNKDKIVILPNSSELPNCDFKNIRIVYNIPKNKKIILYFGRIIEQKGLDLLIKAVKRLDNSYYLVIAGNGSFKEICQKLALGCENVCFVGAVNPKFRKNFFSQCDLFVFPGTFREGRTDVWGLTINEALESNVPIISTYAVGSAYDLIDNGQNGFIIETDSIDAIEQAILSSNALSKDEIERVNLKKLKIYNYENMADSFVNTVIELCDNK